MIGASPSTRYRVHPRPQRERHPLLLTLAEGTLAGLAGAAAVALWFFVADLLAGEPLRTPSLIGGALLEQAREAAAVTGRPDLVAQYTVVHVALFVGFGSLIAGLMRLADRDVRAFFIVFALLCCFQVAFAATVAALAGWLLEPVPLWSVIGANLLATAAMMAVIWPRHNVTWRRYVDERDD